MVEVLDIENLKGFKLVVIGINMYYVIPENEVKRFVKALEKK